MARAKLYAFGISHPVCTARLMPEYPGEPIPLTLPDTQPASKETVAP